MPLAGSLWAIRFQFEELRGGGGKAIIDDCCRPARRLLRRGLLYLTARRQMIVSGGEDVFPAEVEDLISGHPDVGGGRAIGVDDRSSVLGCARSWSRSGG